MTSPLVTPAGSHGASSGSAAAPLQSEVAQRAAFDKIRYAQSWEDPASLEGALAPNADSRLLSIAAAGDNSFALLLQGAGHVVSVDMSPAQCALVELKRAAVRTLTHEQLLRFVGVTPGADRAALYLRVRAELPQDVRGFWDGRPTIIAAGIIHVGKLENMWRVFRTRVLPLLHGTRTVNAAFTPRSIDARARFWDERWNNLRWSTVVRLFFSQPVIGRLGRDPSFFEHVRIDVGAHYRRRARHAFVELDPSTNPFLQYIFTGTYLDLEHGHPWLAPSNHELLRERLDRLDVVCAELEAHVGQCDAGTYTGCNLSDIFEWMSDAHHDRVYRAIATACAPDATLAYWNNLVPRSAPRELVEAGVVEVDDVLARRLHRADRSFLYRDFHVDRIRQPERAAAAGPEGRDAR